jgi:hypothetical protein
MQQKRSLKTGRNIEAHCFGSTPNSDTVVEGEVADSSDVIPWKSMCFNIVLLNRTKELTRNAVSSIIVV